VLEQVGGLAVSDELVPAEDLRQRVVAARPDMLLVAWEQLGGAGSATLQTLRSACPRMLVIALANRGDARPTALQAGADFFVAKNEPPDALLDCLETVAASGRRLEAAA
jgi:DNA-binding NarL/FixJ family response regulator